MNIRGCEASGSPMIPSDAMKHIRSRKMRSTTLCLPFRGPTFVVLTVAVIFSVVDASFSEDGTVRPWRFDFGPAPAADGWTAVSEAHLFSAATAFGFEANAGIIVQDRGGADALRRDFVCGSKPFRFSLSVPEGNYRVKVTMGDKAGESVTTVKAETRRLMLERVATTAGKQIAREFTVNVRDDQLPAPPLNAPGGTSVVLNRREIGALHWDDKLTLEFSGPDPKVCAVEIERVEVPTVFLVGDSTVADQPLEPAASWGQMFTRFLAPTVAVANHAESGETMKSFISGLRLAKVLSQLKDGDYMFIQFGHNDSKSQWPQTYAEAHSTYRAYLRVFIAEARLRGAIPVLVTSMQRRQFDKNARIRNSHGDYPAAVRAVAEEEGVPLIDLERMSKVFYEALGPEVAQQAFVDQGRDATHHNEYGAYELAKCVVQGILDTGLPLAAHIWEDFEKYDPARPDPVEWFARPRRTNDGANATSLRGE